LPYTKAEEMSATEKERIIKLEGAEQVYEDDKWKIIVPTTLDAACLYGKSTRWCTASPGNSMFHSYSKNGPLYILIDKKELNDRSPKKKLQFHFPSNQFMDTTDSSIKVKEFFSDNPALKDFFKKRKEITPAFEFEHKLLTKDELLMLLKTAEEKLQVIDKKGFKFFKELYFEMNAKEAFTKTIIEDQNFIKGMFERGLFGELVEAYIETNKAKNGLQVIQNAPWLRDWILNIKDKKQLEEFIVSLFKFGEAGKKFASELCKFNGLIWKSCLSGNGLSQVGQYFNIISRNNTFGSEGIALAKKLLKDPQVIKSITDTGATPRQIAMIHNFYKDMQESIRQSEQYYNNILS
jgi:hypothetical protein